MAANGRGPLLHRRGAGTLKGDRQREPRPGAGLPAGRAQAQFLHAAVDGDAGAGGGA